MKPGEEKVGWGPRPEDTESKECDRLNEGAMYSLGIWGADC
jgi:hypothetical protein